MNPGQRTTSKSDSIEKEKQRRFKNQIQQFESDMKKVKGGEENPLAVDDRMETALSNIDETVTTLQTRRESIKKKKNDREKKYGKKNLKKIKKQDFHDLKMYEYTDELKEIEAEISDWRAYQIEIQDLSREMLRLELEKRLEDEVDVEAAKRYVEVVEDKLDNIKSLVDSRVDDQKQMIENRIDAEIGKERAETESKVTSLEKDVEYLEKNVFGVLELMTETLHEVAQQTNGNSKIQQRIKETKQETQNLQESIDKGNKAQKTRQEVGPTPEEKPQKLEQTHDQRKPENEGYPTAESSSSSIEGKEVGTGEEDEEEEEEGPKYKFKRRAYSEMKETFEQVHKDFENGEIYPDQDKLSYRKLAEYSDVGKDSIKKKIDAVREEYEDAEICPAL